jgi:Uma2 family endonuclease
VSWASGETYRTIRDEDECSVAPEVCIEVLFSSNTEDEIAEKKALYFEKGAKEVWLCDRTGRLEYFNPGGKVANSDFFPDFPQTVELDT